MHRIEGAKITYDYIEHTRVLPHLPDYATGNDSMIPLHFENNENKIHSTDNVIDIEDSCEYSVFLPTQFGKLLDRFELIPLQAHYLFSMI